MAKKKVVQENLPHVTKDADFEHPPKLPEMDLLVQEMIDPDSPEIVD